MRERPKRPFCHAPKPWRRAGKAFTARPYSSFRKSGRSLSQDKKSTTVKEAGQHTETHTLKKTAGKQRILRSQKHFSEISETGGCTNIQTTLPARGLAHTSSPPSPQGGVNLAQKSRLTQTGVSRQYGQATPTAQTCRRWPRQTRILANRTQWLSCLSHA